MSDVFALTAAPVRRRTVVVAALGMAVPVAVGALLGELDIGFTIGLGAILLAGGPAAGTDAGPLRPASAVVPALLAVVAATALAATPWPDPPTIALVAVAALVSGYSRPLGVAAIRFIVYLVLSEGLLVAAGPYRGSAALIFGLGALWNIALRALLTTGTPASDPPPVRTPTTAQRRAHFRRTLRTLAGWQFPLRLAAGLAVASVVRTLWPAHHFYWIMLTVALLTQRPIEHVPVKTVQRLLGTVAGVGVTWLIVTGVASRPALAVVVCALAGAVPVARARSYLLYSAVATPLILLVLDLGKEIDTTLLTDRLVATVVGGAIVIAGNVAVDRLLGER